MRSTCLYCAQKGTETKLIPIAERGGICPIHGDKDLLRALGVQPERELTTASS